MSKKRPIVKVDEEKIKMIMGGELPMEAVDPEKDIVFLQSEDEQPTGNEKSNNTSASTLPKSGKKKKAMKDYSTHFLSKKTYGSNKKQSTILLSEENFNRMASLLKFVTNNFSVSNFLDNILNHHFEEYEEEIRELKRNAMQENMDFDI